MNPVGVLQRPENSRIKNPRPSSESPENFPSSLSHQIPLLSKMKENYQKMQNARRVVFKKEGQNLFEEKVPRAISYLESIEQAMKDVGLVADWISLCFPDFAGLPSDQKNTLFRNSYTKFCMLEITFMTHVKNTPDKFIMTSGDYIDVNNLEKFYHDPDAPTQMSREEIEKLFKPYFGMQQRGLVFPMITMKMDLMEFFCLVTMILWDIGLDELTDETIEIAGRNKDQVMTELTSYMKSFKGIEEPGIRISRLVNLLPALERCVRKFQDDMEMTQIFNFFKASKEFYDLVNGNFC